MNAPCTHHFCLPGGKSEKKENRYQPGINNENTERITIICQNARNCLTQPALFNVHVQMSYIKITRTFPYGLNKIFTIDFYSLNAYFVTLLDHPTVY